MSRLERLGLSAVPVRARIEHGSEECFDGTVDVYRNYIDIFRKDKKPAPFLKRVVSSLSKKGRFAFSVLKSDISSFEESENSFILILIDGSRLSISPVEAGGKEQNALSAFCGGI